MNKIDKTRHFYKKNRLNPEINKFILYQNLFTFIRNNLLKQNIDQS